MRSGRHGMRHQTSQPTSATRTSVASAYRQVSANMPVVGVKGVVWYTDLPGGCPTFTPTHAYDPADNPFYDNLPHDIVEAGSAATVPADRKGLVGVPISLLANWPEGYRLVGMSPGHLPEGVPRVSPIIGGRPTFRHLLVERI